MTSEKFRLQLKDNFPFEPTDSQRNWFNKVADFILSNSPNTAFLLKGYAGTGKTTLIGYLIRQLKYAGYKGVLMAPTGRAAKVMATYSKFSVNVVVISDLRFQLHFQ